MHQFELDVCQGRGQAAKYIPAELWIWDLSVQVLGGEPRGSLLHACPAPIPLPPAVSDALSRLALFLSVLPTACSRRIRSHLTFGFAPCSPPKASLLPCSFSSPPPLLSCRLSLGKGGGELGEHGEEPGGGGREEGRLPNLYWPKLAKSLRLLLLASLPIFLLPLRTLLRCGCGLHASFPGTACLSWELSAHVRGES